MDIVETTNGNQTAQNKHIWMPPSNEPFTHDLNDNLTADSRWAYTWDAENRLIAMETKTSAPSAVPRLRLTFAYDAHCRRVAKRIETKVGTRGSSPANCASFTMAGT